MFDRRLIINFDFSLLLAVLVVCALGVVNLKSICSSSLNATLLYYYKQALWVVLGFILLSIVINVNYLSIVRNAYYFHFITLIILVIVHFYGKTYYGSQRWFHLGGISFQPSEMAKITFILALSKFYSENVSQREYTIKDLLFPFLLLVLTFLPIYFQPDLGTSGLFVLIFLCTICFMNINKKSVFIFFSFALFSVPSLWFFLKDYQKRRILVFLNPELDPLNAGYQVIQSKIAVGSGGFFGKGFSQGTQSQLRFLPEQHTDFVFSVWAEEWGFVGCAVLLLLYFFIMYRGLSIAYNSKNLYGSFLALGLTSLLFIQTSINIFMTIGCFPVVGVPLPYFSYGGSSMLTFMLVTGLLLNINMRKFK